MLIISWEPKSSGFFISSAKNVFLSRKEIFIEQSLFKLKWIVQNKLYLRNQQLLFISINNNSFPTKYVQPNYFCFQFWVLSDEYFSHDVGKNIYSFELFFKQILHVKLLLLLWEKNFELLYCSFYNILWCCIIKISTLKHLISYLISYNLQNIYIYIQENRHQHCYRTNATIRSLKQELYRRPGSRVHWSHLTL